MSYGSECEFARRPYLTRRRRAGQRCLDLGERPAWAGWWHAVQAGSRRRFANALAGSIPVDDGRVLY